MGATIEGAAGATLLLSGESAGFASDFTFWDEDRHVLVRDSGDTYFALDAFFSNAGTSPKRVFDATGALVWSAHNMLLQSEDFTATWTDVGTTTPVKTAHTIEDNETDQNPAGVNQAVTVINGATYTALVRVAKDEVTSRFPMFQLIDGIGTTEAVHLNTSTGASAEVSTDGSFSVTDSGEYWDVALTLTSLNTTLNLRIFPARTDVIGDGGNNATVGTITIGATQFNRGTVPTAYLVTTTAARFGLALNYDPITHAPIGLLPEPLATNVCLRSKDFTTTWTNTNTDEPTTNNADPAGLSEADEIAATATADQAFAIYQGFTGLTAGNTATCSVYLKAGVNATLAQLAWDSDGSGADGCFCNFNLSTGAKGTITAFAAGTATTARIESVGNGWYRCSITGKIAAGTVGRFTVSIVDIITAAGFEAANLADNDSILAWGAQVEATASSASVKPTSFIETFAASVTRAADRISVAASALPLGSGPLSAFAQFEAIDDTTPRQQMFELQKADRADGTFGIRRENAANGGAKVKLDLTGPGFSSECAIVSAATYAGVVVSIAGRVATNDAAQSTEGAAVVTDTSVTVPTTWSLLRVGERVNDLFMSTHLRQLVIVPRAWSDAELQLKAAA
jgi:hypothetical protein